MAVSIYGATGVIGSYYQGLFNENPIPRTRLQPKDPLALYFISTTTNSNVYIDPTVDIRTNLIELMKRLDACRKCDIKEFNFVSSWYVYGRDKEYCHEDDICTPQGFYSITKRTAEQLVIDYCTAYGITWRIFRLGNVYGGTDKNVDLLKRNSLHSFINLLKDDREVVIFEGVQRDYIHIFDVCRALYLLIYKGEPNTIYNVGTGTKTAFLDLLLEARDILGSKSRICTTKPATNYSQSISNYLDVTRLQNLGFSPIIDIHDGLKDLCLEQKYCTPDRILMDRRFKQQLIRLKKESGTLPDGK